MLSAAQSAARAEFIRSTDQIAKRGALAPAPRADRIRAAAMITQVTTL